MFSTLPYTNFNFSATFILSSANAFNLGWSKMLPFGKELMLLPGRLRERYLLMYLARATGSLSGRNILISNSWWKSDRGPRSGDLAVSSFSLFAVSVDPGRVSTKNRTDQHFNLCHRWKNLNLYHKIPTFNDPEKESCWKHSGERRKCFFSFSHKCFLLIP